MIGIGNTKIPFSILSGLDAYHKRFSEAVRQCLLVDVPMSNSDWFHKLADMQVLSVNPFVFIFNINICWPFGEFQKAYGANVSKHQASL